MQPQTTSDGPDSNERAMRRLLTSARQTIDSAEPATLVAGTLAVAGSVALAAGLLIAELVDEVMDPDEAVTPDDRIVDWINQHASPALTTLFRTATRLADYWFAIIVVATTATILIWKRHRGAAFALIASSAGAALVTQTLKEIIGRERPPIGGQLVAATGLAFPSGHSSQSVACYGGLALATILASRRTGPRIAAITAAVVIAFLVGTSRVYLGVHWPSDVVAGWIVGLTWLTLVAAAAWLLRRLNRPRGWWPERPEPT